MTVNQSPLPTTAPLPPPPWTATPPCPGPLSGATGRAGQQDKPDNGSILSGWPRVFPGL